ncbi:MAG: dihydroorotase [Bacteroidales bacterium]|nr:dihydroorotase [Bacteroidales bacterium]
MGSLLIKNALIVNEGRQYKADIFINDGYIQKIYSAPENEKADRTILANNKLLLPGIIDDQVHFREPGLTHKGDIASESAAAAAGGVTSYLEMPNTSPQAVTHDELEKKFDLAEKKSVVNYSFYLGATNDNIEEIKKTDPEKVCGIKVFMGSSTGNMLVDKPASLQKIFAESPTIIATHCEDESIIRDNTARFKDKYGENMPFSFHPQIRSEEACYKSSALAAELADRYNSRLHILHLSTGRELALLTANPNVREKKITGEVCVHHLWFSDTDYASMGAAIKWNPAIKTESDKQALLAGLLNDKIDVVATDHAPHTIDEKARDYFNAPSGGPLVQHSLVAMLELHHRGLISLETIVKKMCHAPADLFRIKDRGYIRQGYKADLVLVDINSPWKVDKSNLLYKCKWSPFEGMVFNSKVSATIVNGQIVYENGEVKIKAGERLSFEHR